ncbi:MCE family protein [Kutzneria sp. CA-103260]|uniref:MCE family protein n=1 Tax=Kutzneria sp. CA-103260 TaxID=2802641 RepID=UPI001BADA385|nr:MlaD family protein [Kutzneria sp. CA-103260]QUQ70615.1 ABC transporter substrate-binding protein [Kutzneria sp. CA-103260]
MLTRRVRLQIIAFVVIALVGVSYAGFRYAGLDRMFGPRGYAINVALADSGGIFTGAEVTYRGVTVGRVGPLTLTKDGVRVELDIDSNDTQIPADSQAVVADRSAVGEQYMDLRPSKDSGPYLAAGATIPQARTATPPPVQGLLTNLDDLAGSVPTQSLQTVVDELDTAFQGTGPNLQTLLDTTSSFTQAAAQNLPQTTKLLADGNTVLQTQLDKSSDILSFSHSLAQLAAQLKSSDGDLRKLIANAPPAADQIDGVLRDSGVSLGNLTANLLTTSQILLPRKDGLEQILVTYPAVIGGSYTVIPGDGTAHFGLAVNLFDPPPCTKGYEGTQKRAGDVTTPVTPNTKAYCAEPTGSPIDVRGAQNAPYGGKPATPAAGTGGSGQGQQSAVPGLAPLAGLLPGLGSANLGPAGLAQLLGLPS